MAAITVTTEAKDLQTLVARSLIVYTMPNLVFGNIVLNLEGEFDAGDTLSITSLTRWDKAGGTAPTVAAGAEPTTTSFLAPTETQTTIQIAKFYYGAFQRGMFVKARAQHDWSALYTQSVKDGLKIQIDSDLAANVASIASPNTVGTLGSPLTDDNVRRAGQYLDDNNVPAEDRAGVLSPAEKNDKLSLERWTSQDFIAGDDHRMREGFFKRQYGADWYFSTNLAVDGSGHDNVLLHKELMMFAIRREAGTDVFDLNNPNTLAREVAVLAIWGSAMRRNTAGQVGIFGCWLKAQ